jgi:hypothetical protein
MRETIAHADLLNRIRYNEKTGQFFSRKSGQRLGYIKNERGVRAIDICNKKYPETRLAVFYIEGKWPIGNVRHTSRSNRVTKIKDLTYSVGNYINVAKGYESGNVTVKNPSLLDRIKSWFKL